MDTNCFTAYYKIMQINNKKGFGFIKKSLVLFFVLFFVFSPISVKKAEAQWVVFDPGNFANSLGQWLKEFGLDAIGWQIVNLVIERLSASTVNWINSGFRGKPAYVEDPARYFQSTADVVAGDVIFRNPDLNFLCGPLKNKIQLALSTNYAPDRRRWHCTLSQIGVNFENFMDDFNQGGWNAFFAISQQPQNNPLGVYLMAENELQQRLARETKRKEQELSWGKGFLSFKTCGKWSTPASDGINQIGSQTDVQNMGQVDEFGIPSMNDGTLSEEQKNTFRDAQIDAEMEIADNPRVTDSNVHKPRCLEKKTTTPGAVISDKLNDVLNIGNDKLAVADEINEIVSALLNQLVNRVVGGIGGGLRGLSRPDPANNNSNSSFTSDLTSRRPGAQTGTVEGYFGCPQPGDPDYEPGVYCDRPDTSVLDLTNPNNPTDPNIAGINTNNLVYPPRDGGSIGVNNPSGSTPQDQDCNGVSQSTLNDMAQSRSSELGIPLSEAMQNLDCGAPGINITTN